jgi:hypothetical protein
MSKNNLREIAKSPQPDSGGKSMHPSPSAVGIFWAIQPPGKPTILLDHRCPLGDAETYGDMLTSPHGHYDLWERWRRVGGEIPDVVKALVAASEYEEWPRGRIVCDTMRQRFTCYADAKILRRADLLATIRERFGLPPERTMMKRDNHYRSTMLLEG